MAMLRSAASRGLTRSLASTPTIATSPIRQQFRSQLCTLSRSSPLAPTKPIASKTLALARYQSFADRKPIDNIDPKAEESTMQKSIRVVPELVSSTSTTHSAINSEIDESKRGHREEDQEEMLAGVKADLNTIRDTFSMHDVPKPALYVGLAGVLPYLATSLSTVYCAAEIKHAATHGTGFFLDGKTAELALHIIEPLQVGYGAVILSFLGAIHWGLEFGGYDGYHGYRRYAIGVITTACAWPTLLMPIEYALISQFLVFNFLYYTDSRAVKRGWAPAWYNVYRFVLTFIVGASIVASLIGRGQIADHIDQLPSPAAKIKQIRDSKVEQMEEEEEARIRFLGSKSDDDEEDEDEEEEDDDE